MQIDRRLLTSCRQGRCVLFAGAHLRVEAGLPSWESTLKGLLGGLNPRARGLVSAALSRHEVALAAELFEVHSSRDVLVGAIGKLSAVSPVPKLYKVMSAVPFAGAVTENWDDLVERAFQQRNPVVVRGESLDDVTSQLPERPFVVVKLHGDVSSPNDLILSDTELDRYLRTDDLLRRMLLWLNEGRTWLFCGARLESVGRLLDAVFGHHGRAPHSHPHFALVPRFPNQDGLRALLEAKYGLQTMPYVPGQNQCLHFLSQLRDRTSRQEVAEPGERRPALNLVRLENIGPFRRTQIALDDHCNVILGQNGAGKSTLLRAIAMGLAADAPEVQSCAERLLRAGSKTGRIELALGERRVRLDLTRTSRGVRLSSPSFSALETSKLAVLAFGALRSLPETRSSGPASLEQHSANVTHVLPLLRGSVDTRLGTVEQWLINLSVAADSDSSSRRVFERFFELIRELTPAIGTGFARLDRETWRILVETDDGPVPFEQISQGMLSTYALIGTILQRLTDVHREMNDPLKGRGVVLIDEIDAHLHPELQQSIVPFLRKHFPQVQLVVTSHSPLVVAGLRPGQVIVARRGNAPSSPVVLNHPQVDVGAFRADQILTSPLFGLVATRAPKIQEAIGEFSTLVGKSRPTPAEKKRLSELQKDLTSIRAGETESQRVIEASLDEAVQRAGDAAIRAAESGSADRALGMLRRELILDKPES